MARFEFDEGVQLMVDRVPGTKNDRCIVYATTSTAAIKGLCWLTEEVAKELGMSKEEVLCRLAVILTAPERKGQNDGNADV